jgi:hypothetical protein
MLDAVELVLWFLPDFVSIGQAVGSVSDAERSFERRLELFSQITLAHQQSPVSPGRS